MPEPVDPPPPPKPRKRWLPRLRFSLRTLVITVLLMGSAGGLWWQWEPWVVVRLFRPQKKFSIDQASLSPDGSKVMTKAIEIEPQNMTSTSYEGKSRVAQVWSADSGTEVFSFPLTEQNVVSSFMCPAEFTPDSKWIIVGNHGYTPRLLNASTGEDFFPSNPKISLLLIMPHERVMAVYKDDNAELWDTNSKTLLLKLPESLSRTVTAYGISSSDTHWVAGNEVWDAQTGRLLYSLAGYAPDSITKLSKDGRWILVCDGSNLSVSRVTLFSAKSGEAVAERIGYVLFEPFSPDSSYVLIPNEKGAYILKTEDPQRPAQFFEGTPICGFSNDSNLLLTYSGQSKPLTDSRTLTWWNSETSSPTVRLWDISSGRLLASVENTVYIFSQPVVVEANHECVWVKNLYGSSTTWGWNPIRGVQSDLIGRGALSQDKTRLLLTGEATVLLDSKDQSELFWFRRQHAGALSGSGHNIVSIGDDGVARYWSRRRPEYWWGVTWLPEFWLTALFAGALVWSMWRDRKRFLHSSTNSSGAS